MRTELSLQNNNLGSEGVRSVGDMLLMNDSLRILNLNRTNMCSGRSAMGVHAIGSALRTKNKGLLELYMMENDLREEVILEFAYSLYFNRGLLVCDLRGNPNLNADWFLPDKYLLTKLLDKMPTIRTSLDRNKKLKEDPVLAERYAVKPRPMEDEVSD